MKLFLPQYIRNCTILQFKCDVEWGCLISVDMNNEALQCELCLWRVMNSKLNDGNGKTA